MATIEEIEVPGIKIDYKKLAEGTYQMMLEHPDSAALRYGMLLMDIVKPLEEGLKKMIPDYYLIKGTGELVEDGKYYRNQVMNAISSYCLSRASEDGLLMC